LNASTFKTQVKAIFKGYGWFLHAIYWSITAILFYFQLQSAVSTGLFPYNYLLYASLLRIACLFLLCYSFLFLLIPEYKPDQRLFFWLSLFVLILFWDLILVSLVTLAAAQFPSLIHDPKMGFWQMFQKQTANLVYSFAFFIAFYYFRDIFVRQREIQQLAKFKTEKIALESSFLKSQVNPHFLFNTLNNIYALSLKKSEQTAVIIERLESLLQYMLYECKADLVPLSNEFTFTNSYIALEKLRHREEQCVVTVDIRGDINHQNIAPLLLINFLENAFKHGTKTSYGKSWINMNADVNQKSLHFVLQNSKPLQISAGQPISEYKGGIGLKNVKRRLEILYPGKHELMITDQKDRFDVDLTVIF